MPLAFAVTWDYRCPFARNAHEHVLDGLAAGADWDVTFLPFSLGQVHVEDGEPDVWDNPDADSGLLGLQVGVAVRDTLPDRFLDVAPGAVRPPPRAGGLPPRRAGPAQRAEGPRRRRRRRLRRGRLRPAAGHHQGRAHRHAASHDVWGVPTFIVGDQAAFVRFMHRPDGDGEVARRTIERAVDLLGWPDLNEFKHTSIPH